MFHQEVLTICFEAWHFPQIRSGSLVCGGSLFCDISWLWGGTRLLLVGEEGKDFYSMLSENVHLNLMSNTSEN